MLKQAIELLQAIMEDHDAKMVMGDQLAGEVHDFLMRAYNYKPTVFITIQGGNIGEIDATEEIVVSKYDHDLLEEENNTTEEEWTRMIESGLNSGQLININY